MAIISETVNELMFDYDKLDEAALLALLERLSPKLRRWVAAHHPDNRTRKKVLRSTNVQIGARSVINSGIVISDNYKPLLRIGDRVAVSPNVTFVCASGPNNSLLQHCPELQAKHIVEDHITVEDDVWIGAGAVILPGVRICRGAVIGASAVVNRSVPAWSCCAGVPARTTRTLTPEPGAPE